MKKLFLFLIIITLLTINVIGETTFSNELINTTIPTPSTDIMFNITMNNTDGISQYIYSYYNNVVSTLDNGLIAYWGLNNNTDDDLGIYNGTIQGNVVSDTVDKVGGIGSYTFDGTYTSHINITPSTSVHPVLASISLWYKKNGTCGTNLCALFTPGNSAGFSWNMIYSSAIAISAGFNIGGADIQVSQSVTIGSTWHHVVWTYNGSMSRLYFDGEPIANISASGDLTIDVNSGPRIGAAYYTVGNGYAHSGNIDEVSFWNRSITEEEVSEIYALGAGKFYPFLGATWVNDTAVDVDNQTSITASVIKTMPSNSGYFNYTWFAQSNLSIWTQSNYYNQYLFFYNSTSTSFTNQITNNSLPNINDNVRFNITINSNYGIKYYKFSYYNGSEWLNNSNQYISNETLYNASITNIILNLLIYNYTWYATDIYNIESQSDYYYLNVDLLTTFGGNIVNNSFPNVGNDVNFSININDSNGINQWRFSYYNGTDWVNDFFGTGLCYQESSNLSNQTGIDGTCNQQYTGSYLFSYGWKNGIPADRDMKWVIDGSWSGSAGGQADSSLTNASELYINYTVPITAIGVIWQVYSDSYYTNLTIPTSCFVNGTLYLMLQSNLTDNNVYYYCKSSYGEETYNILVNNSPASSGSTIFEEGIYWILGSLQGNETVINATITKTMPFLTDYNYTWYVRDNYNVETQSDNYNLLINTPMLFTNQVVNNSLPFIGNDVQFNITINDLNGLNSFKFSYYNNTWINDSVNMVPCYQETANISTLCGGLNTGRYSIYPTNENFSKAIDGDWNTYFDTEITQYNINMTYTIPQSPQNIIGAIWQIKINPAVSALPLNLTIPTSCYNYSNNLTILLRMWRDPEGAGTVYFTYNCLKGDNTLYQLRPMDFASIGTNAQLYEEAIFWTLNLTTSNLITIIKTIPNVSLYNYTWYGTDINNIETQSDYYSLNIGAYIIFDGNIVNNSLPNIGNDINFSINISNLNGINQWKFSYYTNNEISTLDNGLIAYWGLNNNTNDELGLYDGTAQGNAVSNVTDKVGGIGSYTFDGIYTTHINMSPSTALHPKLASISLWYKKTGTCGTNVCALFTPGNSAGFSWNMIYSSAIAISAGFNIDGTDIQVSQSVTIGSDWHHVVWTYNGSMVRLYFDGEPFANTSATGDLTIDTDSGSRIGTTYYTDGNGYAHNGNIDEVGFWNRSITEEEVSEIYALGAGKFYPFSSLAKWNNNTVISNNETLLTASIIKTMPTITPFNYTWYATDINSIETQSNNYYLNINTPMTFTNNITNNTFPAYLQDVQINITINDLNGINNYMFSYYNGSEWINDSMIPGDNLTTQIATISKTIIILESIFNYTWYGQDSNNLWIQSDYYYLNINTSLNLKTQFNTTSTWVNYDIYGYLNATDVNPINYTIYCIDTNNTCTPDIIGNYPNITCAENTLCTQYIRYYSVNILGDIEALNSNVTNIDKITPSITLILPTNNTYYIQNFIYAQVTINIPDYLFSNIFYLYNSSNNLVSSNFTNSSTSKICYQEFVNETTSCGGLDTGTYYYDTAIPSGQIYNGTDGDWNTGMESNGGNIYINYTKPVGATNNSLWRVYDSQGGDVNLSLSLCWDAYSDKISLLVSQSVLLVTYYCFDNLSNTHVITFNTGSAIFYEEAMYWDINIGQNINFTSLPDNLYYVNASILDIFGNYNQSLTHQVILDTTLPVTVFNVTSTWVNTDIYGYLSANDANINYTIYCIDTEDTCTPNIIGNYPNITCVDGTLCTNYIRYYSVDLAGNIESTKSNQTNIDKIIPSITLDLPINNTYYNQDWIYSNITINIPTNLSNITIYLYNSSNELVNFSLNSTYNNFTSLIDGLYYVNASIIDIIGNYNQSLTHQVILDTTNPSIVFSSDTLPNDTVVNQNWIWINLTIEDMNYNYTNITVYYQNMSIYYNSGIIYNNFTNVTNVPEGRYYYKGQAYDKLENTNSTELRLIRLAQNAPVIILNTNNEFNNSNLSRIDVYNNNLYLNISFNSVNLNYTRINITCDVNTSLLFWEQAQIGIDYTYINDLSLGTNNIQTCLVTLYATDGTLSTTSTYNFYLTGTVNLSVLNVFNNSLITGFTVTSDFNDVYPFIGDSGLIGGYLSGAHTFTFATTGYFSQTYTVSLTDYLTQIQATTEQAIANVYVRDIKSSSVITNATVLIIGNGKNITQTNGNTNNVISFNLSAGNYTAFATASNYFTDTINFSITSGETKTINIYMFYNTTINIYDEKTLAPFNFSNITVQYSLFCGNITATAVINSLNFTTLVNCSYSKFRIFMDFGTLGNYYRTFIIPENTINVSVYMIDLRTTTAISNDFVIDDLLKTYVNPSLYVKKNIITGPINILSDYFDVQKKVTAFLIQNNEYYLEIHSDNQPVRLIGTYMSTAAGTIPLRLYDINLAPSPTGFGEQTNLNVGAIDTSTGTTRVIAMYNDSSLLTTSVTWTLFKRAPGSNITSIVTSMTVLDQQNVQFVQPYTPDLDNNTLCAVMNITYNGKKYAFSGILRVLNATQTQLNAVKSYFGRESLNWFITVLLSIVALGFTIRTSNIGAIIICLLAAFFIFLGLTTITWALLSIATVIALITFIKDKSNEG